MLSIWRVMIPTCRRCCIKFWRGDVPLLVIEEEVWRGRAKLVGMCYPRAGVNLRIARNLPEHILEHPEHNVVFVWLVGVLQTSKSPSTVALTMKHTS